MKDIALFLFSHVTAAILLSCSSPLAFSQNVDESSSSQPEQQEKNQITAIFIADTQIGYYDDNQSYTKDSLNLELTVAKINQVSPDFVVVNGDMTNSSGSKKQLACFWSVMRKVSPDIPVWYVPGNHDVGNGTKDEKIEGYIREFGYDRFSFTMGNNTFIGINSCLIKDERSELEDEQFRWLKRAIKAASRKKNSIYICCHHPFFIKKYDEKITYSNQSHENRDKYWNLFKENGVDAVFAGHVHNDEVSSHDGIAMITVGPVSKALGSGVSGIGICTFEDDVYDYEYIYLKDL